MHCGVMVTGYKPGATGLGSWPVTTNEGPRLPTTSTWSRPSTWVELVEAFGLRFHLGH